MDRWRKRKKGEETREAVRRDGGRKKMRSGWTGVGKGSGERERKKVHRAIYSNLTLDSMALNNRPRLRRNWSPFNNGLLSNELVLSAKRARLGSDITPRVSRCCDSKEVEINLSYNHFFCGPRPTTGINQISSFRALSFARFHALSPSLPAISFSFLRGSAPRLIALAFYIQEHRNIASKLRSSSSFHARTENRILPSSFPFREPHLGRPWSIKRRADFSLSLSFSIDLEIYFLQPPRPPRDHGPTTITDVCDRSCI